MRISCLLFGHQVRNPCRHWRVEAPALHLGGATRIRHVVGCFLGGHNYVLVGSRDGHQEFRCVDCGHPLLFRLNENPYVTKDRFRKKVRYLCNLLGHEVHHVTERHAVHEYACHCGHTFLKQHGNMNRITHPLSCLFAGHLVMQISRRNNLAELVCCRCGHTFLIE